jgi:hypothetical protein
MKVARLLIAMFVLVASLGILSGTAAAQGPTGSWVSGITCVNVSTSDANLSLDFFTEGNATAVFNYTGTIVASGTQNYFTPSNPPGVPSNFVGSVVVSSSAPIVCNVNTQSTGTGTAASPYRIGTSAGVSTGAPKLYVPQVEKAYGGTWNSYIAIQNAGATDATVAITYRDRNGAAIPAANESYVIPPNTNKIVYQGSNANLPAGFLGSAVVDGGASASLVAVVNFYNSGSNNTTAQFLSYNAFSAGAEKVLLPRVIRNYYNYNGGITIQNVGTIPTNVTINFYMGGNTYTYTSPAQIAVGASLALYLPNVAALNPVDALAVNFRFGFAEVTAETGASIVAIVNEDNRGGAGQPVERAGQGATYNGALAGQETTKIMFPQIPKNKSGFSGGFIIANTTNTAGTCNITFSGVPAANLTGVALAAKGSISRFMPNIANLPDGFNGGVSAECTVAVVGIANLSINTGTGKLGDSFTQSNGLNQ